MNTKYIKLLAISITIISISLVYFFKDQIQRTLAFNQENQSELSPGQKQKWDMTQQFQIKQTNESLIIDIPHREILCAQNLMIHFNYKAPQTMISGTHPTFKVSMSCQILSEKNIFQIELKYSDLDNLNDLAEISLPLFELTSNLMGQNISSEQWALESIEISGANGFTITEFEIQKVFNHNFEFLISK